MAKQEDVEENIYDKAFDAILNTRFNAPGIPVLTAFKDEGEKGKKKRRIF